MAPLRTVETLDKIAARIENGGRKLKKPDRRVLNALQTFDLTELVGSMMNTLHSGLDPQTKHVVNHQTYVTAAKEAGVSLQTLKAAFAAANGNGAGELYPKDAAMNTETETQTDPPPPGPDTEEGGMQTDVPVPDTEEGGTQTDPQYQPSGRASKMPVKKPPTDQDYQAQRPTNAAATRSTGQ